MRAESCERELQMAALLDGALDELRDRGEIDVAAWRSRYPDLAEEVPSWLAALSGLEAAIGEWRDPAPTGAVAADTSAVPAAEATRAAEVDLLPEQVGRYHILGRLGVGGMGTVYRAYDPQLRRAVALKVPRLGGPGRPPALLRERFLREARAAAAVRHPHVCPIYDVGEHQGIPYVVMAQVLGQSLAERLAAEGRFEDCRQAVTLARQVAEALAALHARGITHRDVKPGNILIDTNGEALLSDFGLARSDEECEPLTAEGTLVGTPAYMAPEQLAPQGQPSGPATDVYALGVVLYQILTGRLPFQGSVASLIYHILHETPESPAALRPGLDSALAAIIEKAMARHGADRYPSAAAFATALATWLDSAGWAAETGAVPSLISVTRGRNTRGWPGGAAEPGAVPPPPQRAPPTPETLAAADEQRHSRSEPSGPRAATDLRTRRRWHRFGRQRVSWAVLLLVAGLGTPAWLLQPPTVPSAPQAGKLVVRANDKILDVVVHREGSRQHVVRVSEQTTRTIDIELPPDSREFDLIEVSVPGSGSLPEWTQIYQASSVSYHTDSTYINARSVVPSGMLRSVDVLLRPLEQKIENSVGMELALIASGKFLMGSPADEEGREESERRHESEVRRPFYVGVHEVTQKQYERVMGKNPSFFVSTGGGAAQVRGLDTQSLPVESVSWEEASEFCKKLSRLPEERRAGRTYRLPTEAEWEYACRAGTTTRFATGNRLDPDQANFRHNTHGENASAGKPFEVGRSTPNGWGLYDMHGNVAEWCADRYRPDASDREKGNRRSTARLERIVRGGAWRSAPEQCRSAWRGHEPEREAGEIPFRANWLGFRVVCMIAKSVP